MAQGSIVARVFTSSAEIPLIGAAVRITRAEPGEAEELLAFRLTDVDGMTEAFDTDAPDAEESQFNGPSVQPFSLVDMMAEQVGYDRILVENVQVFAGVETQQDFQLIPTAELPDRYDRTEAFHITAQDL